MAIFDSTFFDPLIFDTGSAPVTVDGTSSVTLAAATSTAAGQVVASGAGAATLAPATTTATGRVVASGQGTATLGPATSTASGQIVASGQGVATLTDATQAASGQIVASGQGTATLDNAAQASAGEVIQGPVSGAGFAILQDALQSAAGTVATPAEPPIDWAPPLDLAASAIIGQALRFLRLAPVARHDPGSELLPALADAFDQAAGSLLADADWSFASTVAHLPGSAPAILADDTMPGLATLPGDLVRIRQVWPQGARWRIDGRTLRHDAPSGVTIRYTARVTREDALPATFRTALALAIATRLAGRFAGSGANPEDLDFALTVTLKQALRDDSRQASEARWNGPGLSYGADDDWALEATA